MDWNAMAGWCHRSAASALRGINYERQRHRVRPLCPSEGASECPGSYRPLGHFGHRTPDRICPFRTLPDISDSTRASAMTDLVLIPVNGEWLAFDRDEFDRARRRAAELIGQPAPANAAPAAFRLLTAKQMEEATGIPASWFMRQASERRIPAHKWGRYWLFDPAEIKRVEGFQRPAIPAGGMATAGHENRCGSVSR